MRVTRMPIPSAARPARPAWNSKSKRRRMAPSCSRLARPPHQISDSTPQMPAAQPGLSRGHFRHPADGHGGAICWMRSGGRWPKRPAIGSSPRHTAANPGRALSRLRRDRSHRYCPSCGGGYSCRAGDAPRPLKRTAWSSVGMPFPGGPSVPVPIMRPDTRPVSRCHLRV